MTEMREKANMHPLTPQETLVNHQRRRRELAVAALSGLLVHMANTNADFNTIDIGAYQLAEAMFSEEYRLISSELEGLRKVEETGK